MKRSTNEAGCVRERKNRRRGSKWLAALLFTSAGVLLVLATVLAIDVDGANSGTGASIQEPGVWGPMLLLEEWAGVAGRELKTALRDRSASVTSSTGPVSTTTTSTAQVASVPVTHPIAEPARMVIPAISVRAKLIPVGLLDDGAMETPPFGLAGWYKLGPVPGATGPAVIVAHVDSKKGPDVFYRLRELKPGDKVEVYGADGDVAVFTVESQEEVLKKDLPTERIWNQTDQAVLRLITCGGEFDAASGHYLSNTIVYAHLEES